MTIKNILRAMSVFTFFVLFVEYTPSQIQRIAPSRPIVIRQPAITPVVFRPIVITTPTISPFNLQGNQLPKPQVQIPIKMQLAQAAALEEYNKRKLSQAKQIQVLTNQPLIPWQPAGASVLPTISQQLKEHNFSIRGCRE